MSEELVINYSSDIIVKVRHNQDVLVELAQQGPQGPQGEKGDTGSVTPELNQAKLDAQAAASTAVSARNTATGAATTATTKAGEASASATAAKTSETNAKTSETNAKTSETNAKTSETNAASSKTAAATSEANALAYRNTASGHATTAGTKAAEAAGSATAAKTSETNSKTSETNAKSSETAASGYADAAKASADAAQLYDPSLVAYHRQPATPANTNINTLVTNGVWFFEIAANITTALNFPVAGLVGRLIVDKSLDGQKLYQDYQAHSDATAHYRRSSSDAGATWSTWSREFYSSVFSTVAQSEAEAGTATTVRWWTAQRVRQAIAAYAATKVHSHEIAEINGLQAKLDAFIASPAFTGTPTVPTAAQGDRSLAIANTQYVREALDAMIGAAPGTLDTLQEIADALGDDPNFAATMTQALAGKSDAGHKHVMSDITDLAALIATLAPKASPALTGTPTAPTAAATVNTTQIATTAHVKLAIANAGLAASSHVHAISDVTGLQAALDAKAPLASPALTGTPTAPTQAAGNNSTRIATTAFVTAAIAGKSDNGHSHVVADITGLQAALDGKFSTSGGSITGDVSVSGKVTASGYADFARFYGTNSDSASAPSFTNASDLNTGLWFPGADSIGFTTGGVNRMTISGNTLTMNGAGTVAMELGRTDGTASTPYLDFHSGATATDYDSRILASGGTGSSGGGSLTFTCSAATFSGTVTAVSFSGNGAALTNLNASNIASGTLADARIPSLAISKITNLQTTLDAKVVPTGSADDGQIAGFSGTSGKIIKGLSPEEVRIFAQVAKGGYSGRDFLMNGNFRRWLRNSQQTVAGYGSHDRWMNNFRQSPMSCQRYDFAPGQTEVPGFPKHYVRTNWTPAAASDDVFAVKSQVIWDTTRLGGRKLTLTFWARASYARPVPIEFYSFYGSGGSPSANVSLVIGSPTITTAWQRFSIAFDMTSLSGKTIGTDGSDRTELLFWLDSGTNFQSRNGNMARMPQGWIDLAMVSLVEGDATNEILPVSYYDPDIENPRMDVFCQVMHLNMRGYAPGNDWALSSGPNWSAMRRAPDIIDLGTGSFYGAKAFNFYNVTPWGARAELIAAGAGDVYAIDKRYILFAE